MIHFNSSAESGNIFHILGRVRCVMVKQNRRTEFNYLWEAVKKSGSYEAALEIIGRHVPLTDDATGNTYKEE